MAHRKRLDTVAMIKQTRRWRKAMGKAGLIDETERLALSQSGARDTDKTATGPEITLWESERKLLAVIENMPVVTFRRD